MKNNSDIVSSGLTSIAVESGWKGTVVWRNHWLVLVSPDGEATRLADTIPDTIALLVAGPPTRRRRKKNAGKRGVA